MAEQTRRASTRSRQSGYDPILSLSFFENCRSRVRVTSLVPPVVEGWFIVGLHFTWNLAS